MNKAMKAEILLAAYVQTLHLTTKQIKQLEELVDLIACAHRLEQLEKDGRQFEKILIK